MLSLPSSPLKIIHLQYSFPHFLGFSLNEVYKTSHKVIYFRLVSNATKLNIIKSFTYEKFDNIKKKEEDILDNKFKQLQV